MSKSTETQNKAIVLEAFDTLFNKRDYITAARFWSPNYVQHSAHIEPGRDGLFNLIKGMPPTFKHEHEQVVADGELVIVHSRFSGFGQAKNWIVADFVRVVDGLLVEHWDVVEDEASKVESDERHFTRRSAGQMHGGSRRCWVDPTYGIGRTHEWPAFRPAISLALSVRSGTQGARPRQHASSIQVEPENARSWPTPADHDRITCLTFSRSGGRRKDLNLRPLGPEPSGQTAVCSENW